MTALGTPTRAPVADGLGRVAPTIAGFAAVVGAFYLLGAIGFYDLSFIVAHLAGGIGPAETSLGLTTLSFAIGFFLALPLGMIRAYPPRFRDPGSSSVSATGRTAWFLWPFYALATGYVQTVRGTPFLVQVFVVYYAIIFAEPRLMILGLGPSFWAALLALTINTMGYQAEALRGGFQSVDRSQVEAGRAIGLTRAQIFRRIIFPQGIRLVTLPLTNEWISNFKTSAIVSYIAVFELFSWSRTDIAYKLARPIEAFVMLAILYFAINATLSRVVSYLEARYRIPGLGSPTPEIPPRSG